MASIASTERWPLEQLVKLQRAQPSLVQRALQRLLDEDKELRWSIVVNAYLDGEISMARAASLLDMHTLELRAQFSKKGIPLYIGPIDKADAQAEIEALRAWKRETTENI
jgi:predicted HTH domain antitoxin